VVACVVHNLTVDVEGYALVLQSLLGIN